MFAKCFFLLSRYVVVAVSRNTRHLPKITEEKRKTIFHDIHHGTSCDVSRSMERNVIDITSHNCSTIRRSRCRDALTCLACRIRHVTMFAVVIYRDDCSRSLMQNDFTSTPMAREEERGERGTGRQASMYNRRRRCTREYTCAYACEYVCVCVCM